jgi:uncharacterized protein YigA (DUF484 family)
MTEQTAATPQGGAETDWRAHIMTRPDLVLDDRDLMRALIAANERRMGGNVVDMRGIAMERMSARLDRLETTHRSVIAAAYENLAGTTQIHRCVLRLLDCRTLADLLDALIGEVTEILRLDEVRLVLESTEPGDAPHAAVAPAAPGFVEAYLSPGRDARERPVTLRQCAAGSGQVFGGAGAALRSEALLRLDLGAGRLPALLVMGSRDPQLFRPNQGTELLEFLAAALQRMLRAALDA